MAQTYIGVQMFGQVSDASDSNHGLNWFKIPDRNRFLREFLSKHIKFSNITDELTHFSPNRLKRQPFVFCQD